MEFKYPSPRRDDTVVDDYHGQKICDPYRWMEDPDAEETKEFVNQQNAVTEPFLEKCAAKQQIYDSIKEMWDYPKYGCPKKRGDKYYYFYNTGLQNQSVLYVQDNLDAEAKPFLDPNQLSDDGTVAINSYEFSEDGKLFAYGLSHKGSDWVAIKFRDCSTGEDLPDVLERVKFTSIAWTHDNKGIFYNCYPEHEGKSVGTETSSNVDQKLYYHLLGTTQSADVLCAEWPDNPKWMTGVEVSDCGRYLVYMIRQGCDPVNRLYYCDLENLTNGITGILPYVKVVDNFDAEYEYITNEGTLFTFKTNLNASNYKLINIDLSNFSQENWQDLIHEDTVDVLEWAACVHNDRLVLCYLHDVKSVLHLHDLKSGGRVTTFPLDIGSISGYSGKKKDAQIFYQFASFLTPGIIYHCDLTQETLEPKVFRSVNVKGFNAEEFLTDQVFYKSKDGTKIPMFIVHKKGLELNGDQPVLLYGYGGFNISLSPYFSVSRTVFMKHLGGVFALANIRGGGEYGENWHKGGMLGKKQNCFDDFQAAAQYLIDAKYTRPQKIVIQGGSNGGLLVGACINQRPDLFGCAIAQVGVMDMLRFHQFTIGHAWTTDFGCADNEEEFKWLIKYSPLHNIHCPATPDQQYPATLLLTADHDDRVVPLHSLKYIAQLQYTAAKSEHQKNPLMIKVDTKAGHGAGKPTTKVMEELRDVYSFITLNLGLTWK